jgi:lipid A 3-O-deacylase
LAGSRETRDKSAEEMTVRVIARLHGGVLAALLLIAAGGRPALAQSRFIDEVKLGVLAHDVSVFGNPDEDGVDINAEILFPHLPFGSSDHPGWLNFLLTPRPNIGGSVNVEGETSFGYFGLVWTKDVFANVFSPGDGVYASFGFGGAVHDGQLQRDDPNRDAFGSRVDFHLAAEIGYRFDGHFSTSIYYEHISNANLVEPNQGLNNLGLRVGYRF